ncbi:MAG: sulfatase-like hydrolase/transferase [Acidimicrobiales bacterium]|nr:sulfatase-like hydrolase/transferase [Acidimicrobiales bacterium]
MTERRNVLFILADQLQAWALGCMGHPDIATPNLDALAGTGTVFTDAYVEFPVCTQYRGVLNTGRYASDSGVTNFGMGPDLGTRFLADALSEAGLWTSYVGKWHLYEFFDMAVLPEQRCGFERFNGYQSYNSYREGIRFWDEDGACREFVGGHRTVATADIAIERLREIPADRDFGLFVSFLSPHYPLEPLAEYEAMYAGADITLRPNVTQPDQVFTRTYSPPSPQPFEGDPNFARYGASIEDFWQFYAAMVTQLDHEVGRLLAELQELGRADDTLVIFTSDHGEMGGSHGRMNKYVWQEESVRVPFLVRSPGSPTGTRIATPVAAGVDIWPTVLDWIGADAEPALPGGSIVPMLDDGSAGEHHPVFAEATGMDRGYTMVRNGAWKYVAAHGSDDTIALHHLGDDPYEQNDVAADHPDEVARLGELVREWKIDVGVTP